MAFLRPQKLTPQTFVYQGSVDNLTDVPLGYFQMDADIFYVDYVIEDANDTFDDTLITLEYDEAAGADTVLLAIQTGAATGTKLTGTKDYDDMTTSRVPAGARLLLTVDNVTTGADTGLILTFHLYPRTP